MSSTVLDTTSPPRTGTARVAATVALAAAGPAAIAVIRGILPYDTVDDPATIVTSIQAAPATTSAVLWLVLVALLTLPLGLAVAGRLAMRERRVFGTVAASVAWVGFLCLFAVVGIDQVAPAAAAAGLSLEQTVALDAAINAHPMATVAVIVFVLGHILGAVLLGIALWRAIPRWTAIALIVSQPMHFVFAVVVPNDALDALAWSLTAVGFGAAALVAARSNGSAATAS